jgi:hypothetical protein
MKIYSPLPACFFVQGYGIKGTAPSMMKAYQDIGLKYGHNGLDWGAICKDNQVHHGGQCEPVYMNVAGVGDLTVITVKKEDNGGHGINARAANGDIFCWWHFDIIDPTIYVGCKISFGQRLGISGNTGMSTGAHCHFGWYPAIGGDPEMKGAADPTPYLDYRFCGSIKTQIDIIQKLLETLTAIVKLWKK